MLTALRTWRCRLFGHQWSGADLLQKCTRCGQWRNRPTRTVYVPVPREDLAPDLTGAGTLPQPCALDLGAYLLPGTGYLAPTPPQKEQQS